MEIKKGEKIAIVGLSGAGKTTLAKIISGLYTPKDGDIVLYSNQDVPLTAVFSYVPQQAYVFSGTVFENIAYGNPSATKEEVIQAAKSARIHDEIMKLENGYETVIAEKGSTVSGGQRQRLTIARAFLKNAPILVMDEATSALDVQSERLIYEAMDELMADKTVIVIAHRLSTIKQMDRVIVMDQGEIVEDGSHEELMALEGRYYQLVVSQFQERHEENEFGEVSH